MINTSKEFKEKLKNGANIVNYADVTLADGTVLNLTYKDFMIGGCQIEDKTTDGKFGVGFCIGKTLTMRIENQDERFSQYDFYGATINLYVAMQLDDGSIEKIRKGIYYVTVPSTTGSVIEINAVDGMFRLDQDYSSSKTSYPATLQKIISDACLDCGIPIGFRQFDNMNFIVKERPESVTYRQVVSWACQIAGYNAHIDNAGYMRLIWYNTNLIDSYNNYNGGDFKHYPHDTILDGGNFKNYQSGEIISGALFTDETPHHIFRFKELDVHTDDVVITGVRVTGENDTTSLFGEEGYLIEVSGNSFVNGKEKEVADYLGRRVAGITFRPFSGQVLNNPLYEPYDVCMISDSKGNVYYSYINSVSYTIGSYTQISCEAEDPLRNGSTYFSASAQAIVTARRNTENQLTTYDKAVQNMNQIAMNAMGFHTTYEEQPDGSRITYLHDKPLLKDSKTIYKQTIDGFFISEDGGKSYAAGFDKNGNAVFNILNAIGINADWINAGTLTGRNINNGSGTFLVDENGNCTANSFNSANANITGGSIVIESEGIRDNHIRLKSPTGSEASFSPVAINIKWTINGITSGIHLSPRSTVLDSLYVYPDADGTPILHNYTTVLIGDARIENITTNVEPIISSDESVKTDISEIHPSDATEFIMKLRPVMYKLRDGSSGRYHHGLIAGEVKDAMETDWGLYVDTSIKNKDFAGAKGALRYGELIPDIIASQQHIVSRINNLESALNAIIRKKEGGIADNGNQNN